MRCGDPGVVEEHIDGAVDSRCGPCNGRLVADIRLDEGIDRTLGLLDVEGDDLRHTEVVENFETGCTDPRKGAGDDDPLAGIVEGMGHEYS